MRLVTLLFIVIAGYGFGAWSAPTEIYSHDPRPLTGTEKETFYPLVCIPPGPPSDGYEHSCGVVLGNRNVKPIVGDGPVEMTFRSIAYGSYTKAGADEAYVNYSSNMEGEVFPGGGILFERKNGVWRLVRLMHGARMDQCVALPGRGRQRMLCLVQPQVCCGTNDDSIYVTAGLLEVGGSSVLILHARDGPRAYEENTGDAGGYEFCAAGAAGKTLITSIESLKRSDKPGILAEARIEYVTPRSIQRACRIKQPWTARSVSSYVDFKMDGDRVKVMLPKGITALSAY